MTFQTSELIAAANLAVLLQQVPEEVRERIAYMLEGALLMQGLQDQQAG